MWSVLGRLVAACALSIALLTGCQNNKKGDAPPADDQALERVREEYRRSSPPAIVGRVIALERKGRPFAAVGDVPMAEFSEGDSVTFVDSLNRRLTQGVVRFVGEDAVHVEWMPPPAPGKQSPQARAPRVGDLVVRRSR